MYFALSSRKELRCKGNSFTLKQTAIVSVSELSYVQQVRSDFRPNGQAELNEVGSASLGLLFLTKLQRGDLVVSRCAKY